MPSLRDCMRAVARTPLHPQWLLGPRRVPLGATKAGGVILDIGAADRWIEPHLTAATRYIALDFPSTGRDLYGAHPHVYADAARLPFADDSVDGVVCLEVLEHVADPAMVMCEIARVLRPGHRGWLSMPFLYPLHDAPFDFQRYTEFGIRRDVERAGLQLVALRKTGHALRTAGLLMCLAISGAIHQRESFATLLLLPLALAAVVAINLLCWVGSLVWPDWKHMALGYEFEVHKS